MSRRILSTFFLLLCLLAFRSCSPQGRYVRFDGYAQGGVYCVKLNTEGVSVPADSIKAGVEAILKEIDFTLSGYNKASLLSRLNAGERITPTPMLEEVYLLSRKFFDLSEGAFDVSCGPLFDVWGFGFTSESMPSEEKIAKAASRCGMSRLKCSIIEAAGPDGTLCAADLLLSGGIPGAGEPPILNFNAIAQGYTCDKVAAYLHSLGVKDMLVDIGEIYCEGLNPMAQPWSIGIDTPTDGNNTPGADMQGVWHSNGAEGQGVVTSGNYRKFYLDSEGNKFSHTIDPRTRRPVTHALLSATVIASDAATADAVATWCMVEGPDKALELLGRLGLEGCLICASPGGGMETLTTPGFEISTLN